MISDVKHFFMYLLNLLCSVQKFCPHFYWVISLLLSYRNSFYILNTNVLSNIFSPNLWVAIHFLKGLLISSSFNFTDFYCLVLSVACEMLDSSTMIVDLSISSFNSLNICLSYFKALLLSTYTFMTTFSSYLTDSFIIMQCKFMFSLNFGIFGHHCFKYFSVPFSFLFFQIPFRPFEVSHNPLMLCRFYQIFFSVFFILNKSTELFSGLHILSFITSFCISPASQFLL